MSLIARTNTNLESQQSFPDERVALISKSHEFVRGPISCQLIEIAASSRKPSTVVVLLALAYLGGLFGLDSDEGLRLTGRVCKQFGIGRKAKASALHELKQLGLITVEQASGRAPVVRFTASAVALQRRVMSWPLRQ